jgi:integrase
MSWAELRIVPYSGNRAYVVYLDGYKVNGRRKRIYFTTEEAAEKKLAELKKQQKKEGTAGLDVPLELRVMAVKAAKRLEPFNKSILDAAEFYAAHLKKEQDSVPIATTIDDYLAAKNRAGLSARHLRDIEGRIARFKSQFAERLIKTITVQEIETWLHSLELGPQSTINYRAVAHAFFEHSRKRGLVHTNPVSPIEKSKVVDQPPEIFTPEELAKLLKAAPADLLPALCIQAFAGLRTEEMMRLSWGDVDQTRRYITVGADKSKTARRRLIPIATNLNEWLRPFAGMIGPVWSGGSRLYHKAIAALRGKIEAEKWPQNGLRHSFASYHLAKHQNAAELALQMGHTSTKLIFSAYRELVCPEEAEKYWSIRPKSAAQNVVSMGGAA